MHLEEGKASKWSAALKRQIINNFINEDQELAAEIEKRDTFLNNILGFLVWLGSLLTWWW